MELTRQSVEYGSGAPVPGIPLGYGQQRFLFSARLCSIVRPRTPAGCVTSATRTSIELATHYPGGRTMSIAPVRERVLDPQRYHASFIHSVRSELRKLINLRSFWIQCAAMVIIYGLIMWGVGASQSYVNQEEHRDSPQRAGRHRRHSLPHYLPHRDRCGGCDQRVFLQHHAHHSARRSQPRAFLSLQTHRNWYSH